MPTYDYKCKVCGDIREIVHSIHDSPQIKCPICLNITSRIITKAPSVKYNCTGFHNTDYQPTSGGKDYIYDQNEDKHIHVSHVDNYYKSKGQVYLIL